MLFDVTYVAVVDVNGTILLYHICVAGNVVIIDVVCVSVFVVTAVFVCCCRVVAAFIALIAVAAAVMCVRVLCGF